MGKEKTEFDKDLRDFLLSMSVKLLQLRSSVGLKCESGKMSMAGTGKLYFC